MKKFPLTTHIYGPLMLIKYNDTYYSLQVKDTSYLVSESEPSLSYVEVELISTKEGISPRPVHIYTDGACRGNPGVSSYGAVLRLPGLTLCIGGYLSQGTNNSAELSAILNALQILPATDAPILLHTDSQYAIGILTLNWKARANLQLIQDIKIIMKNFPNLAFKKVKGHSGDVFNEMTDKLANVVLDLKEV